jgi:hypothetical protein
MIIDIIDTQVEPGHALTLGTGRFTLYHTAFEEHIYTVYSTDIYHQFRDV